MCNCIIQASSKIKVKYSNQVSFQIFNAFFSLFYSLKFKTVVKTTLVNLCLNKRKNKLVKFSENTLILSKKLLFLFLLSCSWSLTAQEKTALSELEGKTLQNTVRFNFIPVQMPSDAFPQLKSTMGLLGVHYQIPINTWLYGGVGMHAALKGDQGGLFTLGVELGIKKQLFKNIFGDANVHFGGGGGYRYLVNDGAFINPNIGLTYQQKKYAFGVQYSHLNFYSGAIKSNSISFFLEIPSVLRFSEYKNAEKQFIAKNVSTDNFWKKPATKNALQVRFDFFKPIRNSKKDAANNFEPLTETLSVLGFEYQKYIQNNTFLFVHTDAIYKGLRAGFMDLFLGAGYHPYQNKYVNIFTKLALGAAGGRVAPEGGLMMYPSIGMDLKFTKNIALSSHAGYYRALDGDLEAYTIGFGLKYFSNAGGTKNNTEQESFTRFKTQGIKVHLQNQTYFNVPKTDSHLGPEHPNVNLQLIGFKISYNLNKTFYITGETGFAYQGESGGYAHGMAGFGMYSPSFFQDKVRVHLEISGGAAGGAGVDTGEGLVIKPTVGFDYEITNRISLFASSGKMISPVGSLNVNNINIGASFGLSTLTTQK